MNSRDSLKKILDENIEALRFGLTKDTLNWYIYHHLLEYRKTLISSNDHIDLDRAASKFGMFCTESMDWDTPEYRKWIEISEIGDKISRRERSKE